MEHTTLPGWKEVLCVPRTEFARDIICAQPRHMRLDYVFWEYLESGSAAPLIGLHDTVSGVTMGRSFADLQALCDRMVWIDPKVQAGSVVDDLNLSQEG